MVTRQLNKQDVGRYSRQTFLHSVTRRGRYFQSVRRVSGAKGAFCSKLSPLCKRRQGGHGSAQEKTTAQCRPWMRLSPLLLRFWSRLVLVGERSALTSPRASRLQSALCRVALQPSPRREPTPMTVSGAPFLSAVCCGPASRLSLSSATCRMAIRCRRPRLLRPRRSD